MNHRFESIRLCFLAILSTLGLSACLSGGGDSSSSGQVSGSPGAPAVTCASVTYAAPSGVANDIVFTFDKPYVCGQFANGDWWVAKDASGFVTITAITPNASAGKNGFEVNPSSPAQQAFDSTASVPFNAALMPALPLAVTGVSSVVKGVSKPVPSLPQLQFAAVLTVVNAPIANSSEVFRPGYFGAAGKVFYNVPSAAAVAGLPLGSHTAVGVPSAAGFTMASIVTRYRQVQLDHNSGFAGRDMHPADNMPDYGAQIATDNATYLLRMLLSDFNYSNATHRQALIGYLQMAIDIRAMAVGGSEWNADGGHANGRKLPLQFAHMVFGGTDFSNAIAASIFSEDRQVYRSVATGEVLWGRVFAATEVEYWRTTIGALGEAPPGGAKDIRDYYGRVDGAGYQLGQPAEYQGCCTSLPWKYTVLALYLLGLESPPASIPLPATSNLVEYVERWVNYGYKAADTITNINLTTGVITPVPHGLAVCARPLVPSAALYGVNYGPDGGGSCIVGLNNWTVLDNTSANGGGYGSVFGNELWAWYR
jgi:hypothetical protein